MILATSWNSSTLQKQPDGLPKLRGPELRTEADSGAPNQVAAEAKTIPDFSGKVAQISIRVDRMALTMNHRATMRTDVTVVKAHKDDRRDCNSWTHYSAASSEVVTSSTVRPV